MGDVIGPVILGIIISILGIQGFDKKDHLSVKWGIEYYNATH